MGEVLAITFPALLVVGYSYERPKLVVRGSESAPLDRPSLGASAEKGPVPMLELTLAGPGSPS